MKKVKRSLARIQQSYDPHLYRHIVHPISNLDAFISIVKCSIGTGCLEMPRAFCNAGWLNGLIGTFAVGSVMIYALHILLRSMYRVCKRRLKATLTYPQCMYYAMEEGPPSLRKFSFLAYELPPLSERKMFNTFDRYPYFFGTVLFAMESVGVIIAIEKEMEHPKDYLGWFGILNISSVVSLIVYATFGFFGYWHFGCTVYGSITLNLPPAAIDSQIIKVMFIVAIFVSYALQGYVIVDVLWRHYLSRLYEKEDRTIMEFNIRCFIVLATIMMAYISPDISIVLPLVGSFCLTILGFVFPALMDLCVKYKDGYGRYYYVLVRDVFLISFGLLTSIIGSWVVSHNIRMKYGKKEEPSEKYRRYTSTTCTLKSSPCYDDPLDFSIRAYLNTSSSLLTRSNANY
ncbi:hypothetical protein DOY81_010334 [Sarcophaga bullata]|nr:hypothetical protein DOY81_010334 [Sarcophaga bullata]